MVQSVFRMRHLLLWKKGLSHSTLRLSYKMLINLIMTGRHTAHMNPFSVLSTPLDTISMGSNKSLSVSCGDSRSSSERMAGHALFFISPVTSQASFSSIRDRWSQIQLKTHQFSLDDRWTPRAGESDYTEDKIPWLISKTVSMGIILSVPYSTLFWCFIWCFDIHKKIYSIFVVLKVLYVTFLSIHFFGFHSYCNLKTETFLDYLRPVAWNSL